METYLGVCNFHQKKFKILILVGCGPRKTITPKSTFFHKSINICRVGCRAIPKAFKIYLYMRKKFRQNNFGGFGPSNPTIFIKNFWINF